MTYLLNIAIAFDFLVNAVLGGLPRETMSSRAHRMQVKKQPYWSWLAAAIDFVFFSGHCAQAYAEDRHATLPE